jgi:hypothetical protein
MVVPAGEVAGGARRADWVVQIYYLVFAVFLRTFARLKNHAVT